MASFTLPTLSSGAVCYFPYCYRQEGYIHSYTTLLKGHPEFALRLSRVSPESK